ncbi:MAG: ABC transporter ATP-binding protein [Candidatus Thermoplasmatota archaeon]
MVTGPAIEAISLSRRFGSRVALHRLDLRVERGCIFGLLGLNGAGKSTTLRILSTLLPATAGRASILGIDVQEDPREARRQLGIVGEESGRARLSWRVGDYLTYFGGLHGLSSSEVRHRAVPILGHLGIEDAPGRGLHELSAGTRKKVEIVRAMLPRPPLLLLDEPTKDLDIPTKRLVWAFFRSKVAEDGLTILLTSHDPLEIEALCETVAVLREGVKVFEGGTAHLLQGGTPIETLSRLLDSETKPNGGEPWRLAIGSRPKIS